MWLGCGSAARSREALSRRLYGRLGLPEDLVPFFEDGGEQHQERA